MSVEPVTVTTGPDDTVTIRPLGDLSAEHAVGLRGTLVHAVRRLRPSRLVVDLRAVSHLDSISLGTVAAACHLGDDHHVAVFIENPSATIASQLTAAGVAAHRLRNAAAGAVPPG
ncbi:STAS domain-containing protein [Jidongwangia harbinensis]|uniref:STAS domain-containing protein n=1 Tax=Jidongwangia harbinensis TaxID=2878561 RepID=UPI001CDA374E|nr:STAS domain-containing protein [Jidongwangia harbinensis]MCA2216612.1 STAS domain-containing protein [Jidongwangia harbinensis]